MNPVQFKIEGRTWALLPLDEYQALCQQLDEAADAEAMRQAQARDEESFPSAFVERLLLSGENPVRVWRVYRGLTAAELARRANVSNAHVSAIETGASTGSVQTLRRIADALDTTIDTLVLS